MCYNIMKRCDSAYINWKNEKTKEKITELLRKPLIIIYDKQQNVMWWITIMKNVNIVRVDYRNECRLEESLYRLDITLPTHTKDVRDVIAVYWSCSVRPAPGRLNVYPFLFYPISHYYLARACTRISHTSVLTLIPLYVIIHQTDAMLRRYLAQ